MAAMRLKLQGHLERRNPDMWALEGDSTARFKVLYRKLLSRRDALAVLAEDEAGRAVGMAVGRIQRHPEFTIRISGKIDDVWVEPPFRRRGLCGDLMRELAAIFRARRVERVTLIYTQGNREAERTWGRLGFRPALLGASVPIGRLEGRLKKR